MASATGREEPPVRGGKAAGWLSKVFALNPAGLVMAAASASNFGEKLTHTDALYFTVTVFTTVGFGDIAAKS